MLSLSRLNMLRELSVLGTITAVADALGLTRPAVSKQLAQLEDEVGAVLFERSGRGVALTAVGRRLVEHADRLFEQVEAIEAELAASSAEVSGEIRIAAFGSLATGLAPLAFGALMRDHPRLDVLFEELEPGEGLRAVAARQVDLAVVDDSVSAEALAGTLELRPLCIDPCRAVVSAGHRLAGKRWVALAELAGERWALNRSATDYYGFLMGACRAAGFTPRVVSSCRNMAVALEQARMGWLITVLPSLALRAAARDPDFRLIALRPPVARRIFVALPRGSARRPAVGAVLAALERAAAAVPDIEPA